MSVINGGIFLRSAFNCLDLAYKENQITSCDKIYHKNVKKILSNSAVKMSPKFLVMFVAYKIGVFMIHLIYNLPL